MKFTVNSKKLLNALTKVQKALSQNRIVPATECIRLNGKKNNIHISACNLEVSIEADLPCEFDKDFDFIMPGAKLIDYVKKLADQPVTFDIDDKFLVSISHGRGVAKMQGESALDFPKIETKKGVKFSIPDLSNELYSVAYARGLVDDPKVFIPSIWMDGNCLIAGDGHVVAVNSLNGDFGNGKYLLPFNVSNILLATTGNADIEISKDSATVKIGDVIIKSLLVDDKFPDWRNIIPKPEITIEVNKNELLASIDRVISFSNQQTKLVKLTASGRTLTIEASNNELNEQSTETVVCSDGDMQIQFKGGLLLSALPKFTSEIIKLKFTNFKTSIIVSEFENDDYFALIMPTT